MKVNYMIVIISRQQTEAYSYPYHVNEEDVLKILNNNRKHKKSLSKNSCEKIKMVTI